MADYTWSASSAGNASVAGNWSPNGVPGAGDKAVFGTEVNSTCTFNVAAVAEIEITAGCQHLIVIANNITLQGITIREAGKIQLGALRQFIFNGTAKYTSGKVYIRNFITESPFDSATSRSHCFYTFDGVSARVYYDTGIYPHIKFVSGNHTPEYIDPSVADTTDINFLSVTSSSAGLMAPATAVPTPNDKAKRWISDNAVQAQFVTSSASFDGGYATWSFQGVPNTGFIMPTSLVTQYNLATIKFDKMIISASVGGVGAKVLMSPNSRLFLTDLTIENGASITATVPCAIHLINRPTIKGTWGFMPVADGIYHSKFGDVLGPSHGGTSLTTIGTAGQVIKVNSGANGLEWGTITAGGSGDITGVTIQTDSGSGSKATDTGGSADFSLLGANGVGITNSGATITAVAVPAEIDHDALSNFVAAEHVDWAGANAGTIHASNYTDTTTNTQLSNAQVRTAVEAASDSNVFTDADHTKLNGVATSATSDHLHGSQQNDIATGWWTFAVVKGRDTGLAQRAQAQFYITDSDSGRHRTAHIGATHMYGSNGSNSLQLFGTSSYGNGVPFDGFRIKEGDTYDGAALQINITNAGNRINQFMMDNFQSGVYGLPGYGWTLLDTWLADSDTNGHNSLLGYGTFAFNTDMAVSCDIDLDDDANPYYGGGMGTTGSLFVDKHTRLGGTHTVSNEALTVNGNVMIQDSPTSSDGNDQSLTLKSNADSARIIVSADTDVKVPSLHLVDSDANSGNFSINHSAYLMLDRNSALVGTQNDLILANSYPDKDILIATNTGSAGTQPTAKMIVKHDGKVGIGITAPENSLHVKTTETTGDAAYAARFQAAEGNVGITRYGGIHLDNDNTSPTDGAAWSSNRWQIGTRDGNQLDFSYGAPSNTNVAASATDLRITSAGKVGIGLAATDPDYELHVNGAVGFRAPVEVIATNPSPAITESGTVFYMTNAANAAISFTLPANGVAGVQYVIINTLGANITIDSATSSDKINGSTNAVVNTTANAATTVVCVGTVSGVIQWAAFGGI